MICIPDRTVFFEFQRVKNALVFSTKLRKEQVFNHLKAVESMLLIPIMSMDNARLVRQFSGKEDHFTNLLFHDKYFYAENVGVGSSFHIGILHY